MKEIGQLREEATQKEKVVRAALAALEAPIVGISSAVSAMLKDPVLQNSAIREQLEVSPSEMCPFFFLTISFSFCRAFYLSSQAIFMNRRFLS